MWEKNRVWCAVKKHGGARSYGAGEAGVLTEKQGGVMMGFALERRGG
jgi:hypothetical protein